MPVMMYRDRFHQLWGSSEETRDDASSRAHCLQRFSCRCFFHFSLYLDNISDQIILVFNLPRTWRYFWSSHRPSWVASITFNATRNHLLWENQKTGMDTIRRSFRVAVILCKTRTKWHQNPSSLSDQDAFWSQSSWAGGPLCWGYSTFFRKLPYPPC